MCSAEVGGFVCIASGGGGDGVVPKRERGGRWADHRQVIEWTITSLAFKGESDPAGTTANWVIGAAAVGVLERLQPASADTLFRTVDEAKLSGAQHVGRTNDLINQFITWINTYCHDRGRTDTIPARPAG